MALSNAKDLGVPDHAAAFHRDSSLRLIGVQHPVTVLMALNVRFLLPAEQRAVAIDATPGIGTFGGFAVLPSSPGLATVDSVSRCCRIPRCTQDQARFHGMDRPSRRGCSGFRETRAASPRNAPRSEEAVARNRNRTPCVMLLGRLSRSASEQGRRAWWRRSPGEAGVGRAP